MAVSNTDVFVVGNDATVLYSSDAVTFSALNGATNVHFMGLSISPSGKVVMVGNNSNVYLGTTSGVYRIKQLFTPALRKVHFTNAAYGYVVGDNYTARYTTNGGQSFGIVLPQNGFTAGQVPQLTSVFTTKNNEAYLTGKSQYLGKATALTTTLVPAGNSGDDFNDITFTSVSQGFVVGGNATESVVLKISDLTRYSVSGAALNGVFGFKRSNSIIAVGNNAQVVRFDGTTIEADDISAVTNQNLHDVYFHDDINGYAVGENGTLLKTTSASTFDTPTGLIIDLVWAEKDITENFLNQPDQNFKNLYTIDFADRYNGFVGGEYTAGSSTVPMGYAPCSREFNAV